jgi:predicted flap endonuclease-1-like 5' DNA nuclease
LGLLLQIVVFLIIAAALGFAVGWLVRGSRLQAEHASLEGDWRTRLAQMADERDRLRAELTAAGDAGAAAGQRGTSDQAERAARITRLEAELVQAQEAHARHQAEAGRLEARIAELEASAAATTTSAASVPTGPDRAPVEVAGTPPAALARPEDKPDDLQQISGIGPGIERTLHRLGIFHFRQIAAFTPDNVAWVNQRLRFKGRIEREDWIGQAKRLGAGGHPLP